MLTRTVLAALLFAPALLLSSCGGTDSIAGRWEIDRTAQKEVLEKVTKAEGSDPRLAQAATLVTGFQSAALELAEGGEGKLVVGFTLMGLEQSQTFQIRYRPEGDGWLFTAADGKSEKGAQARRQGEQLVFTWKDEKAGTLEVPFNRAAE